jgi:2-haloacid dehalogenase
MEAGEKECTYLSVSTTYVKFVDVFRSIFYRTLRQIGIKDPRSFASDEDREFLLAAYRSLKARPGLATCFSKLREAGFKVWCFTSGDTERVSGYLAAGGVDFPSDNFVSCDTFRISKPAPTAYQYILDKFPTENREVWFAAAHMWDAAAARRNG